MLWGQLEVGVVAQVFMTASAMAAQKKPQVPISHYMTEQT
jgi:hypothetical protein